jgi:hypothetical protein
LKTTLGQVPFSPGIHGRVDPGGGPLRPPGATTRPASHLVVWSLRELPEPLRAVGTLLAAGSAVSLAGRMVPIVNLGRGMSRLNGREWLEDLVGVHGVPGNDPTVARLQ